MPGSVVISVLYNRAAGPPFISGNFSHQSTRTPGVPRDALGSGTPFLPPPLSLPPPPIHSLFATVRVHPLRVRLTRRRIHRNVLIRNQSRELPLPLRRIAASFFRCLFSIPLLPMMVLAAADLAANESISGDRISYH